MPKTWHIPRRTFLRGAGAAIALPWLDVMQAPSARAAAAPAGPPTRLACMYFPNGMWRPKWIPKDDGPDYKLPFSLKPLQPIRSEVLVLTGLDKAASHQGDGHYAKDANFLTGGVVAKTTGKEISVGGVSLDQLAARKIGRLTPLASLELGTQPTVSGVDGAVGFTRLYGAYISWRAANVPVAKEINPRVAYERLFGAKDGGGLPVHNARARDDASSLLDMALEDAGDLRRRLGRDDQHKLDEYLDSVRSVEKRLQFHAAPDPREWKPVNVPNHPDEPTALTPANYLEHVRVMLDLIYLAFWTDTTRIATFMFANSVANTNFAGLIDGVTGAHHELSHHQKKTDAVEQYAKINRWHVEQFVYFLERLRGTPEGDGTLLDHAAVLMGSGMSDGNEHNPDNLPILVGGRGGGKLSPGRHIASPKGTPLCNLYVSLLDCVGVPVEKFGDSQGPLLVGEPAA